jgi:pentatricopeptide repeat protein
MSELNVDSMSLNEQWAMVEFGRAGDPDYNDNLFHERWPTNKRRAMQVFAEYEKHKKRGGKGGVVKSRSKGAERRTLNAYLGVFAEAKDREAVYDVLAREFTARGLRADEHTYKHLVRMHVRRGEIEDAQAALDTARAEKLRPQPDSFGIVIHSLSKRNMVVEALKVLEEAAYAKVRVPERHLRDLRRVCRKLGVKHPDMPVDPTLWLQEMKAARHKLKGTGFKRVQGLRSKTAW